MAGRARGRIEPGLFAWLAITGAALIVLLLRKQVGWLVTYPAEATIPIAEWINAFMDWFVETFDVVFHAISWVLGWPMEGLSDLLHWMPLAGDHGGLRRDGLCRARLEAGAVHRARPVLHGAHRLLGREHEHAGAGQRVSAPCDRHRGYHGCPGFPLQISPPGHRADPRFDADHTHLCLPDPDFAAVRLRPGCRPDCECDLCLAAARTQRDAGLEPGCRAMSSNRPGCRVRPTGSCSGGSSFPPPCRPS